MITPSKDFGVTNIPGEYTAGHSADGMRMAYSVMACSMAFMDFHGLKDVEKKGSLG